MKNRLKVMWAAMALFLVAVTASAEEFSCDMVSTAQGSIITQKLFSGNNKSRMESPQGIIISRQDKQLVWILMPQQNMYMEQPYDPSKVPASGEKHPGEIERTLLGNEAVDGKPAEKYRISYIADGVTTTVLQWQAPGIAIPIKIAAEDGSWMAEYKNIKVGPQPDSLFEIPAGYSKMSMEMPSMDKMLEGMGEGK